MKKIIHFQIPTDDDGNIKVTYEEVGNAYKMIIKALPRYYKVIFSPYKMTTSGNNKLIFDRDGFHDARLEEKFDELIKDGLEKDGYIVELIK